MTEEKAVTVEELQRQIVILKAEKAGLEDVNRRLAMSFGPLWSRYHTAHNKWSAKNVRLSEKLKKHRRFNLILIEHLRFAKERYEYFGIPDAAHRVIVESTEAGNPILEPQRDIDWYTTVSDLLAGLD